jgi:hypothetical protein
MKLSLPAIALVAGSIAALSSAAPLAAQGVVSQAGIVTDLLDEPDPTLETKASSAGAAKASSTYMYISQIATYSSGTFGVQIDGVTGCGGNGWWGVPNSDPGARALQATALAAYLANKRVSLTCDTLFNAWDHLTLIKVQD